MHVSMHSGTFERLCCLCRFLLCAPVWRNIIQNLPAGKSASFCSQNGFCICCWIFRKVLGGRFASG